MSHSLKSFSSRAQATTADCAVPSILGYVVCVALLCFTLRVLVLFHNGAHAGSISGGVTNDESFLRGTTLTPSAFGLSIHPAGSAQPQLLGDGLDGTFALNFFKEPSYAGMASPAAPVNTIEGRITYEGVLTKPKHVDMSKEPTCAKQYSSPPVNDNVISGADNGLGNVVVFVSAGVPDEAPSSGHVMLNQRGCRYLPHVLALQAKQEIWVHNDDDVNHTVHMMTRVNQEWNRLQPPNGPVFSVMYDKPEFVRVKCEVHPWMRGILAIMKNSHFAVSSDSGSFKLPDLRPGKYTITAWHETFGSQSQELIVTGSESKHVDFVFKVKPD